jgi:hypothetical protein
MKHLFLFFTGFVFFVLTACNEPIESYTEVSEQAVIYPNYEGTYIPYNIAPLNFQVRESGSRFRIWFVAEKDSFEVTTKKNVDIPLKKWRKLLESNKGKSLTLKLFSKGNGAWKKYKDLCFTIADEPVDPYIAYRLIEPGYEGWKKMGLYQRCIENYEESPILLNTLTDGDCMNCHSFWQRQPDKMLFHVRGKNGGTLLVMNGEVKKINTKASWMEKAGVYPRWHPEGRYVVFSTNHTQQIFHSANTNKIEVYDTNSDIVMYDTESNRLFTSKALHSKDSYETFPEWSPDGHYLYFCTAPALPMPKNYQSLKYDLVRVAFDSQTGKFANEVDTLVSASITGKSVSIPRISPDGKQLIFCLFDYGTFPIWHRENDLYSLNIETREISNLVEVNSNETDSYHCWSSNGRWLLFSSRRLDGNYTRLFISYFDSKGNGHKPILLPQKMPDYYDVLMKSYNVPEFITGKIKISPYEFAEKAKTEAITPIDK